MLGIGSKWRETHVTVGGRKFNDSSDRATHVQVAAGSIVAGAYGSDIGRHGGRITVQYDPASRRCQIRYGVR